MIAFSILNMENVRKYGKAPFKVAVVHGGPGVAGEMAPVARELVFICGVLEPLQTASSLIGQVEELKTVLEKTADLPVTLIGFSWGAWLSFILTANYPEFVKKLILIGSGPFEEKYAAQIQETRLSRLSKEEIEEVISLMELLNNSATENKITTFKRFGALFSKADAYDPIMFESEVIVYRPDIFQSVWKYAAELRRSGRLLELAKHVKCPVLAIHGDYDPHPADGVNKPLSVTLKSFRFIQLKNCGHRPWMEREVKEEFYKILISEIL